MVNLFMPIVDSIGGIARRIWRIARAGSGGNNGKINYIRYASVHLFSELWRGLYTYWVPPPKSAPPPQALPNEQQKGRSVSKLFKLK